MAATRLYYLLDDAAAVSPAFSAGWDATGAAERRALSTIHSGVAGGVNVAAPGISGSDVLFRQYVSGTFPAQAITGTVKGQIAANEFNAADNFYTQMRVFAVSADGAAEYGELVGLQAAALSSEWDVNDFVNRKAPLAAVSPVTVSPVVTPAPFRIVVEIGLRQSSTATHFGALVFGGDTSNDLPQDETTASFDWPWIEFSADLSNPPVQPGTPPASGRSSRRQRVIAYADGTVRQFATDSAYLGELARLRMPVPEPVMEAEPRPPSEPSGPSAEELAATAAAEEARAAAIERQRIERENEKMLIMLAAIV